MHPLYQKLKGRNSVWIALLTLLTVAKELRYFFVLLLAGQGFPQSEDSQWYLDYAQALMQNFSNGLDMNDVLYLGYNVLLAALLAIFKSPVAVVFLQALVAGLSVILVYCIAERLFNRTTAVLASLFYCFSWDITLWAMYILSDSFFTSLLLLCVYWLLLVLESPQRKYKVLFVLAALYLMIFRPTGVIMVSMMALYLALRLEWTQWKHFLRRYRWLLGSLTVLAGGAGVLLYTGHYLDPLLASVQFDAKKVLYNIYAKGWVYDRPTDHDYFFYSDYRIDVCDSLVLSYFVNNWDHVLFIYGKRALAFLGRWVWSTDLNSWTGISQLAKNIVPSALFLTGTVAAVANGKLRRAGIAWLVVLGVAAFCLLIFIDAMYRYRLPAIPFIAMVAAYGAERILNRLVYFTKRGCDV